MSADDRVFDPPVTAQVGAGKWRLEVSRAVNVRRRCRVTIALCNGALQFASCDLDMPRDGEPLPFPAGEGSRFGIPARELRAAAAMLTDRVRIAMVTAPPATVSTPPLAQTVNALTAQAIASAPAVTAADVLDKEQLLHELAALDAVAYDQRRDEAAQLLGVRMTTLDKTVAARRSHPSERGGTGTPMLFTDPKPWAEAVAGASLLDDLATLYTRYIVLPVGAADMLALWTAHTYTHAAAQVTPRVGIESPQKRCGKTTLLALIGTVAAHPLPVSNITPAALFRTVEQWQPTMLIDEADTFLHNSNELRGVLNAGHTRSQAYVIRTVGEDHEPRAFCVWAPVAIALIGKLPSTLADRAIVIKMRRKLPSEQVERLRLDRFDNVEQLRRRCLRWAQDTLPTLQALDPTVPDGLHDRAADNWRPLCAIAEVAGGQWPQRVANAIKALTPLDLDDEAAGVLLLEDLRWLFTERAIDRLPSAEIAAALHKLEERPWSEWGRQEKPITARQIARLLAPFDIKPKTIRIGADTPKGYEQEDFADAWTRYLPLSSATPPHVSNGTGSKPSLSATSTDSPSATPPHINHDADLRTPASTVASNSNGVADEYERGIALSGDCGGVADHGAQTVAEESSGNPASANGCGAVADHPPVLWRAEV